MAKQTKPLHMRLDPRVHTAIATHPEVNRTYQNFAFREGMTMEKLLVELVAAQHELLQERKFYRDRERPQ